MGKRVILIVTPMVYLLWPIIFILAFIAPYGNLGKFALATVKSNNTDGLQIWMGISGSCARLNYSTPTTCTKFGHYNLSSIIRPSNNIAREYGVIPFEVAKPIANKTYIALIIISLVSSILFLVLLVAMAVYHWTRDTETPITTLLHGLTFLFILLNTIGPSAFLFIMVTFLQAVKIFNLEAKQVGNTEFIAKSGRLVHYFIVVAHILMVVFVSLCSIYVASELKRPNPIPPPVQLQALLHPDQAAPPVPSRIGTHDTGRTSVTLGV